MGKLLRALVVTSAATAAALVVVSVLRRAAADGGTPESGNTNQPRMPEVDAEALPDAVRKDLLTELEGHV